MTKFSYFIFLLLSLIAIACLVRLAYEVKHDDDKPATQTEVQQ